jgi:hypothetical protein
MEPHQNTNGKKTIFFTLGGVFILIFLTWLWHYLHTGKVVITTNNPDNTISLTKVISKDDKTEAPLAFKSKGKLAVTGNSLATTQIVNLNSHKTLALTINPVNTTGVEPVTFQSGHNVAADNNQLIYLNGGRLEKIDTSNNIAEINSPYQLQTIKWASTSFGIGQDNKGIVYDINGNTVSAQKVPFAYDEKTVNYAVSANKQVYVSHGNDIFAVSQNGSFKKVYTAKSTNPSFSSGINDVAVVDATFGLSSHQKPVLAVIGLSGNVTTKNGVEDESGELSWSPGGQYLAIPDDSGIDIYDTHLNLVSEVPSGSPVAHLKWLNDDTLFYSEGDELWAYNLSSQKADLVANMPLANSITGIEFSDSNAYVYLTTQDSSGNNPAIRRVGLKGQKVDDTIFALQDILPKTLDEYSLSLINFVSPPVVLVQPYPDSKISAQSDLQASQTELQQDGINLNKVKFKIDNTP